MKITDKIHLLKIDFEITIAPEKKLPRFVNTIIIFGDVITIIDTGVKGSEKSIFDYILSHERKIEEIDTIILSHSHPDHIGSAAKIKEVTGCKVMAHQLEQEWIENIELQNSERPVPHFFNLVNKPAKIDEFIKNGDIMNISGGPTLKFIKSSGHSKGSLNILFENERILFTADSIPLKDDIPNYDNYVALMQSLDKIKSNLDYDILLTSWTPAIKDRAEIEKLISEGETYMHKIDSVVKDSYKSSINGLENCKTAIEKLGLPPFLVNPIVDKAFRSHF